MDIKAFFEEYKAQIKAIIDEIVKFVKGIFDREFAGEDFAEIL